jgi:hypothetical protein
MRTHVPCACELYPQGCLFLGLYLAYIVVVINFDALLRFFGAAATTDEEAEVKEDAEVRPLPPPPPLPPLLLPRVLHIVGQSETGGLSPVSHGCRSLHQVQAQEQATLQVQCAIMGVHLCAYTRLSSHRGDRRVARTGGGQPEGCRSSPPLIPSLFPRRRRGCDAVANET